MEQTTTLLLPWNSTGMLATGWPLPAILLAPGHVAADEAGAAGFDARHQVDIHQNALVACAVVPLAIVPKEGVTGVGGQVAGNVGRAAEQLGLEVVGLVVGLGGGEVHKDTRCAG